MRIRIAVCTSALVLIVASLAAAHDTWLLPSKADVAVGERVTLDMTSGMAFPKNESAIDSLRVSEARMRLGAETTALRMRPGGKTSLRFIATPGRTGIATIWVRLKPRTLELTPNQVREYLAEIGAPDSIRVLYGPNSPPRRWREQYTKYAKTVISVGRAAVDSNWATPAGLGLEIVPLSNPARLAAGDTLVVRVLRGGIPAANFSVGDVTEAEHSDRLTRTNEAGLAHLVARKAGRWMLRGTDLRRAVADSTIDWRSEFTTLTLFVARRPQKPMLQRSE
jgi:uncharacterized GH25 family protein